MTQRLEAAITWKYAHPHTQGVILPFCPGHLSWVVSHNTYVWVASPCHLMWGSLSFRTVWQQDSRTSVFKQPRVTISDLLAEVT